MHHGKLKELRTRQQYLTGWLMDQGPEIDLHKKRLETQQVQAELYTTLLEQLRQRLFGKTPGPSSKTDISSRSSVPVHRKTPLEFP